MILTITASDFRKLSDSCQRELLGLLGFQQGDDDESIPYEENFIRLVDGDNYSPIADIQDASSGSKRVIDITADQAKELLANISEKSIETLKCFASGEPISLDDLIGENRPYSSLSDLKRSFVGAVNRRLRTVTGNRQAVLFLTTKSDSRQTGTKISVRKIAATSLSQALGLPIPDKTETQ
jgi:hypothetical protein